MDHPRCGGGRSESSSQSKQTPASARRKISRSRRLRQQGRIQKSPEDLKQQNDRLYVRVIVVLLLLLLVPKRKKRKGKERVNSIVFCAEGYSGTARGT